MVTEKNLGSLLTLVSFLVEGNETPLTFRHLSVGSSVVVFVSVTLLFHRPGEFTTKVDQRSPRHLIHIHSLRFQGQYRRPCERFHKPDVLEDFKEYHFTFLFKGVKKTVPSRFSVINFMYIS